MILKMKIIDDPLKERILVESIIKKHGYTPDHNFDWLMYCADERNSHVALWDEGAVWFYKEDEKKRCTIISDPIASPKNHQKLLRELLKNLFETGIERILFLDVRGGVHDFYKTGEMGKYAFYYDIVWPVVNVELFNPALPGGKFKEIRNALNKFRREHKIEVRPTDLVDKKEIHAIVDRWFDNRTKAGIEELYPSRYHNMIDGDFRGTESARVMFVDGKAVGFNGGWKTPNKPIEWSAAIGLHDFSVKDLGLALMIEDLVWIKNAGYKTCDLEGSDSQALRFKTQFFPNGYQTYKTYTFWIEK